MLAKSHKEIIELWESLAEVVSDTGEKYKTIQQWKHRNSIPHEKWVLLVNAAQKRDLPLTYKMLAETAAVRSKYLLSARDFKMEYHHQCHH